MSAKSASVDGAQWPTVRAFARTVRTRAGGKGAGKDTGLAFPGGDGVLGRQQAFEPGIRRGELALLEVGLDVFGVQVRVVLSPAGAGHAVPRPAVLEIGRIGEVRTRIDVPVLGGNNVVELAVVGVHELADGAGNIGTAGHGQGAALAEVVLDVNDDQGTGHQFSS